MKSITTKLSVAMTICMLVAVSLVSIIHMNQAMEINKDSSRQIVKLMCDDNARALDAQLVAIERSVDLLTQHVSFFLYDDKRPLKERLANLKAESLSTANYTTESYSVYFHCNPEKDASDMDFFYVRNPESGEFEERTVDNPYTFQEENGENADWYFASADSKKACWLAPYVSAFNAKGEEIVVASYTVPLCDQSGDLLGVIGMDYTLDELAAEVRNISLYNTGYAFLAALDGTIASHPSIPFGTEMTDVDNNLIIVQKLMKKGEAPEELFPYRLHGEDKRLTFSVLRNGMYLVVTAPEKEISASIRSMVTESQILFGVVMVSSVMVIYCIVYKFIHPLQLLSYASQQIIKGNMKVDIPYHSSDEIGVLTENFKKMSLYLQEHISRINNLAYTDAMTGLKNKASYQAAVNLLQEKISQGSCDFGVVVFDLNNLKYINDSLGHAAGDTLIKNAGKAIGSAFSHSPVYRIGGDEFVVLLENDDLHFYRNCLDRLEHINEELNKNLKEEQQLSMACGMARFEKGKDESYRDVFSRADKEMYGNKLAMKEKMRTEKAKGQENLQSEKETTDG